MQGDVSGFRVLGFMVGALGLGVFRPDSILALSH